MHGKRDSVYAYKTELDEWWNNRGAKLSDENGAEEIAPKETTPVLDQPQPVALSATVEQIEKAPVHPKKSQTAALFSVGLFLALLVVAAWLSNRNSGRAAAPPLPFKVRDWVLVTSFENRTGRPIFDGTLEYALQRELSNSRYVNVVPRERIGDVLRLMRKPPDTRIDAAVGPEVCLRDGDIRALVTGRIERLGSKYLLSVELVDPSQGASIASVAEEAARDEELLPATRRISDRVRAMLGENLPSIREGKANLLKVTTPSLHALQLYSQADALIARNESAAAEELLRQAVSEDPTFASAHIHLAWAIRNQNRPEEEWRPYAETAFGLSATTTERERYFIRGSYYQMLDQREKAIAAYQALFSLYPDHFWGTPNLIGLYQKQGQLKDAAEMERRWADLRPKDFEANYDAAVEMLAFDPARSRIYLRRARELVSPADMQELPLNVAFLELLPAVEDWLDGNLIRSLQVADGLAAKIDSLSGRPRQGFVEEAVAFYLMLGRLEAATQCIQKIPDPLLRYELLSRVAFIKDDRDALKQNLEALEGTTPTRRTTVILVILLARAGLLPQAARFMTTVEARHPWDVGFFQIPRGELTLARGETDRGMSQLEEGTQRIGKLGSRHALFFLGSESLATALRGKGDLARAVRVLERASEERSWAALQATGSLWLRNQSQLAQLYRLTGREGDARKIEDELRKLLALADRDHPIVRALERLSASNRMASEELTTKKRPMVQTVLASRPGSR